MLDKGTKSTSTAASVCFYWVLKRAMEKTQQTYAEAVVDVA